MNTAPLHLLVSEWLELAARLDDLSSGPLTRETLDLAGELSADFWTLEADLVLALRARGRPVTVGRRCYGASIDGTAVVAWDNVTGLRVATGPRAVVTPSYIPTPRARVRAEFSRN